MRRPNSRYLWPVAHRLYSNYKKDGRVILEDCVEGSVFEWAWKMMRLIKEYCNIWSFLCFQPFAAIEGGYTNDVNIWQNMLWISSLKNNYSTVGLILSVLSLPSRKVSWPGMKKPPAQHATSTINFSNQNLIFKAEHWGLYIEKWIHKMEMKYKTMTSDRTASAWEFWWIVWKRNARNTMCQFRTYSIRNPKILRNKYCRIRSGVQENRCLCLCSGNYSEITCYVAG